MQVCLFYRLVVVFVGAALASLLTDLATLVLSLGQLITQLLVAFFYEVFELILYEKCVVV